MIRRKAISGQPTEFVNGNEAFDYGVLESSVAEFLEFLKVQVHRIRRQAPISIVHIGKGLIVAKHYLSRGMFLKWVEGEVGIPARTAQAYMHVAQWAAHKNATVARDERPTRDGHFTA
jgi:hypothetical protein